MKKLFIALSMMLGFATFATAQAVPATAPATSTTKAKVVKMHPATKPVAASGLKADGTPDKRLKANKAAATAPVTGPTKKDGTPDKRFKANKTKAAGTK